jgi:hypothetical protein
VALNGSYQGPINTPPFLGLYTGNRIQSDGLNFTNTEGVPGDLQQPSLQYTALNGSREIADGVEVVGTIMLGIDRGYGSGYTPQPSVSSATPVAHPHGNTQPGDFGETSGTLSRNQAHTSTLPAMRNSNYRSTVPHRSRASSILPPATLPPTPTQGVSEGEEPQVEEKADETENPEGDQPSEGLEIVVEPEDEPATPRTPGPDRSSRPLASGKTISP